MSFNPPSPIDLSGGYTDLSALLRILADPAAHKAKLDELIGAEASAKERIAELHAMEADTKRLHSTAVATNIVADNRTKALDVREAEIEQRASQLEQSESRHSVASIQRRENAAEAREEANKREAERLAAMRKDYENKLAQIQNLAGNLHH